MTGALQRLLPNAASEEEQLQDVVSAQRDTGSEAYQGELEVSSRDVHFHRGGHKRPHSAYAVLDQRRFTAVRWKVVAVEVHLRRLSAPAEPFKEARRVGHHARKIKGPTVMACPPSQGTCDGNSAGGPATMNALNADSWSAHLA